MRITFKVLRAKTDKYNWTYGPDPGLTTLLSATAKIVGQEVAIQCEMKLWPSEEEKKAEASHVIEAVIVKAKGGG